MIPGIVLILAGILIAVYPPLLSLVVAFILIFTGISFMYLGYYYKKASKKFDDPFIDFFFRLK
jgi:Flp pilus assembly protein TadB